MTAKDYDVIIIGSGFGGSIAALRLTEKGYKVLVIEAGARFKDEDFAKTSWNLKKFLFFPRLGLKGIQRIDLLRNVMVMSGAGVGGGSLVYANTLYRPPTVPSTDCVLSSLVRTVAKVLGTSSWLTPVSDTANA